MICVAKIRALILECMKSYPRLLNTKDHLFCLAQNIFQEVEITLKAGQNDSSRKVCELSTICGNATTMMFAPRAKILRTKTR